MLSRCEGGKRQVLSVARLPAGGFCDGVLQEGDLLLEIDETPVNTFAALEACVLYRSHVSALVLRGGAELPLALETRRLTSDGTGHLVMWCGLILQQPYRAVLERGFQPQTGGVYISYYLFGSPAHKYKLVPKHWVVEINGETVPHLRGFLAIVQAIPHGANVRIKTCDLNGKLFAHTVKTDHNYWRGYQLYFEEGSWVHKSMDEPPPKDEGG